MTLNVYEDHLPANPTLRWETEETKYGTVVRAACEPDGYCKDEHVCGILDVGLVQVDWEVWDLLKDRIVGDILERLNRPIQEPTPEWGIEYPTLPSIDPRYPE